MKDEIAKSIDATLEWLCLGVAVLALATVLEGCSVSANLDRIADALERAHPAQEATP